MNSREKFLANMSFDQEAPIPKWEYGYWAKVVRQWYNSGLPQKEGIPTNIKGGMSVRAEVMGYKAVGFVDKDVHNYFNMDEYFRRIPLNNFVSPPFEAKVLEDHEDWELVKDSFGIVTRQMKDRSAPEAFVKAPVEDWEDWEKIKNERFALNLDERLPSNWKKLVNEYHNRDYPLAIGGGQGFYGSLRYLLGDEVVLRMFYRNPELLLDINDHLCNLWINLYEHVLKDVTPDMALIWEDMCYKKGPLISPEMFNKFQLPFYKKLTALFRDQGVDIIFVDTDGNFWELIPSFLEGGVTGLFPIEAAASMEVTELRESYPRLQMIGGVDKRMLLNGSKEDIDQYLESTIFPVMEMGGYIPTIDHLVPPDTPWEIFKHYRNRVNRKIDKM